MKNEDKNKREKNVTNKLGGTQVGEPALTPASKPAVPGAKEDDHRAKLNGNPGKIESEPLEEAEAEGNIAGKNKKGDMGNVATGGGLRGNRGLSTGG